MKHVFGCIFIVIICFILYGLFQLLITVLQKKNVLKRGNNNNGFIVPKSEKTKPFIKRKMSRLILLLVIPALSFLAELTTGFASEIVVEVFNSKKSNNPDIVISEETLIGEEDLNVQDTLTFSFDDFLKIYSIANRHIRDKVSICMTPNNEIVGQEDDQLSSLLGSDLDNEKKMEIAQRLVVLNPFSTNHILSVASFSFEFARECCYTENYSQAIKVFYQAIEYYMQLLCFSTLPSSITTSDIFYRIAQAYYFIGQYDEQMKYYNWLLSASYYKLSYEDGTYPISLYYGDSEYGSGYVLESIGLFLPVTDQIIWLTNAQSLFITAKDICNDSHILQCIYRELKTLEYFF